MRIYSYPGMLQWDGAVDAAVKVCNLPRNRRLDMGDRFELAEWVLEYLGYGGSTFGVEYASHDGDDTSRGGLWYLNAGDTYDLTVAYPDDGCDMDHGGDFVATSWGDDCEAFEKRMYDEEGLVTCGYCSAFTPCAEERNETRCESCGRNVSTGEVMPDPSSPAARLEYLRGELRAESISLDELHELQSLAEFIAPGDVELLEAAGVPEFEDDTEGGEHVERS
jgi:hypothetical protein